MVRGRVDLADAYADRMEHQHQKIGAALHDVRARLDPWAGDPTAEASAGLATSLSRLLDVLVPHLDEEERDVVPVIARCVTEEEWENFRQKAFEKFQRVQRPIAMGAAAVRDPDRRRPDLTSADDQLAVRNCRHHARR